MGTNLLPETPMLEDAIANLEIQARSIGLFNDSGQMYFNLPHGYEYCCTNNGRLTIGKRQRSGRKIWVMPLEEIEPVNYRNIYRPMNTAEAVSEYIEWGRENPDKYFTQ